MDAVIAHSKGRAPTVEEVGLPEERVRVIPHGAFDYLDPAAGEAPLPRNWLTRCRGPVILFGLLRP